MVTPYTPQPVDAFVVAQTSLAAVLSAIVGARPVRPLAASLSVILGIWVVALMPVELDLMHGFGHPPTADTWRHILTYGAAFMALGMVAARPRWIVVLGLGGWFALRWLSHYLTQSENELSAAYLVWFGILYGLYLRFDDDAPSSAAARPSSLVQGRWDDAAIFVIGVTLAALVSTYVLERSCDSADEWAYTFQAAVLSHGRAYQAVPSCPRAHENHWVAYYMGRAFSQYTPGWPLFMAPFWLIGAVWLAGPVAFGLLLVGVARLGRRVVGGTEWATSRDIRAGGLLAAATLGLGACTLFNAGSRYSHIFVALTFAWMIEALCSLVVAKKTRERWFWGLVLGSSAALCLAARPADGAALGFGVFLCFAHALLRGRIDKRGLAATIVGFSFWALLSLVVLRLQLGEWFKTGYSILEKTYGWAKPSFKLPTPDEWKYPLPLMTGAYSFWPCAPALGLLGLVAARGAPRGIVVMLGVGSGLLTAFYCYLMFGRHTDFGYGPRFILPTLVTMAVGSGVALARLLHRAGTISPGDDALAAGAPFALALAALVAGVVRLVPLMYPHAHELLLQRSALGQAIAEAHLHHAVVSVGTGDASGPLVETQNDPNDPDADVIIVGDRGSPDGDCVRRMYAGRVFYRASGQSKVTLTRF